MYELRIRNKYSYGHSTYIRDNLSVLHKILNNLIIDVGTEVKIYEVKEIKPIWINDYEKYNPNKHNLSSIQSKTLYYDACITKESVKENEG